MTTYALGLQDFGGIIMVKKEEFIGGDGMSYLNLKIVVAWASKTSKL